MDHAPPAAVRRPTSDRRGFCVFLLLLLLIVGGTAGYLYWQHRVWERTVRPSPEEALEGMAVPEGFRVSLFASEPLLANPVALCIDGRQRFFLVETSCFRYDTLEYPDAYLACRTWEEGEALRQKEMALRPHATGRPERLVCLEDRRGQGKADTRTVLLEDFPLSDGVAAGVVHRPGHIWMANCPKLWHVPLARDSQPPAKPRALLHGFGVRGINLGHDLHGLIFGPDGKLYFSMGDRGLHVRTQEGQVIALPDTGSVLRCNPDGSQLEAVAVGFRNPQRLAFDDHGNLWTADNDGNMGDRSRLLYVVEGGEYAWRIGYQPLPNLGVWNSERLWEPDSFAPHRLPPSGLLGGGPSGLAHYPGTGLPQKYAGYFFLGNFPGEVQAFTVQPRGAGFAMADFHRFAGPVSPADIAFGPDGALYVLDWGLAITKMEDKGRIFRIVHAEASRSPVAVQTRQLLAEGMEHRPNPELAGLLGHQDQRVRQAAQFTLAERGTAALPALTATLASPQPRLARLHAIWGLGQIAAHQPAALAPLPALLTDHDPEVRAQAAKVLGDHRHAASLTALIARLQDDSPRVRCFAAMALGKLRRGEALAPVVAMLRTNDDQDEFLRHAGVMALAGIGDVEGLVKLQGDASRAVRLAALLALRRLERPEAGLFLHDADAGIVLEAARAIHDAPIPDALPALAALAQQPTFPAAIASRVVNANFRLGSPEAARTLALLAAHPAARPADRVLALNALMEWATRLKKDRVLGQWRPLPERTAQAAADALRPLASRLMRDAAPEVAAAAAQAAATLHVSLSSAELLAFLRNPEVAPASRAETLRLLGTLNDPLLAEAVVAALESPALELRRQGVRLIAQTKLPDGLARLRVFLAPTQPVPIRQAAIAALAVWPEPAAEELLQELLETTDAGQVPPALHLDLLEGAAVRWTEPLQAAAQRLRARRPAKEPLAAWWETLEGGDAAVGRRIFVDNQAVACIRCHKLGTVGGEVGPPLGGVGLRLNRRALLESILLPNAVIAQGYDQTTVLLNNGTLVVGRKVAETPTQMTMLLHDGQRRTIAKQEVQDSQKAKSAMPEGMEKLLSPRELRDLVEFLSTLREPEKR